MSRCQAKYKLPQLPDNLPKGMECGTTSDRSKGDTRSIEMQCASKVQTIRVKSTITMKGENQGHTTTASTFDPPMNGASGMKLVVDWKYMGACPAGVKTGDLVGPDGKILNPRKN